MNRLLLNISLSSASKKAFIDSKIKDIISCLEIAKQCAADRSVCFRRLSETDARGRMAEKSQSKPGDDKFIKTFCTRRFLPLFMQADFQSSLGSATVEEVLLEGRLKLAKELLKFQPEEVKRKLGSAQEGGDHFVQELVEEFLCPASKQLKLHRKGVCELARG